MANDTPDLLESFGRSGSFLPTEDDAAPERAKTVGTLPGKYDTYPYYRLTVEEPHPVEQPYGYADIGEIREPETRGELETMVVRYAKKVLLDYDLELEWGQLELSCDGRLGANAVYSGSLGRCGTCGFKKSCVRISSTYYSERNYSWEQCKNTIRHELAHAWQVRWMGFSSHGSTFRTIAKRLEVDNIARYDGESEPRYIGHCQHCGSAFTRKRDCKRVRNPWSGCGECGRHGDSLDEDVDTAWKVYDLGLDWKRVMDAAEHGAD